MTGVQTCALPISLKDIVRKLFDNDVEKLDTTYFNVIDVLKGEEVLKFDEEIKGNILVASYNEDTFNKNVKLSSDNILIVGDRHEIIENAINSKIKLLIVTGNGNIKKENLESAKENKVNIIRTSNDSYRTSKLIGL